MTASVAIVYELDGTERRCFAILQPGETEAEAIARVQASDIPAGAINVQLVDVEELTPRPAPPRIATARQFIAALAASGIITEAEVSSPNLPAIAEPVVAAFPLEQRLAARATWARMTTVPEDDPLLEAMRVAAGMTTEQKTALFDLALSIP